MSNVSDSRFILWEMSQADEPEALRSGRRLQGIVFVGYMTGMPLKSKGQNERKDDG